MPFAGTCELEVKLYGGGQKGGEVVALVRRVPDCLTDAPLVRLHSACLTGEVFGSVRCDCGPQLDSALTAISKADWGIVLYSLRHEGRGIGLINKVRAYALQDGGLDTVEANTALGFAPDARDFTCSAAVLRAMGARRVRLLSNNPAKARALHDSGIEVLEQIPMDVPINEHNRQYLEVKRRFFGHQPPRDPITGLLNLNWK